MQTGLKLTDEKEHAFLHWLAKQPPGQLSTRPGCSVRKGWYFMLFLHWHPQADFSDCPKWARSFHQRSKVFVSMEPCMAQKWADKLSQASQKKAVSRHECMWACMLFLIWVKHGALRLVCRFNSPHNPSGKVRLAVWCPSFQKTDICQKMLNRDRMRGQLGQHGQHGPYL